MLRAGIMDFFSFVSKNRFASNLLHKEEQLLLVSNLKSVWLCGSPFSVSANFNEVHFCTKKTCQTAGKKNKNFVGFISNYEQLDSPLSLFKL